MAKRANPFVEDFVQQSKIHVGVKQFNNNEDRLKKVYEKTLELLFKGAKKSLAQEVACTTNHVSNNRKNKMKQLIIGKDGILTDFANGIVVPNNNMSVQECCCGSTAEACCGYCETWLCPSCQHLCIRCERPYCTRCSLTGSEGSEVCVSCYG